MVIRYGFDAREATLDDLQKEVGPGWSDLLRRLVDDLFAKGWDGRVLQVKEKFGGLRFYINKCADGLDDRISQAEDESYRTCEECGLPGVARSGGWIKTLCDLHAAGRLPHSE